MARKRDPDREAERRGGILAAAARAFMRDGLKGASIASICKEAGISPGLLYYYFPSKESLVEAMAEADLAEIRHYAEGLSTLDDLLTAAVTSTDPTAESGRVKVQMLAGPLAFDLHAEAQRNPRIQAIVRAHYRAISETFGQRLAEAQRAGQVAPGHDPVRLARLVGAMREGLLTMSAVNPDLVDADMRAIVRRMLETAAREG
jgi:TetR/AcrR family transcriptional regulator, repressor for uid operon